MIARHQVPSWRKAIADCEAALQVVTAYPDEPYERQLRQLKLLFEFGADLNTIARALPVEDAEFDLVCQRIGDYSERVKETFAITPVAASLIVSTSDAEPTSEPKSCVRPDRQNTIFEFPQESAMNPRIKINQEPPAMLPATRQDDAAFTNEWYLSPDDEGKGGGDEDEVRILPWPGGHPEKAA